MPTSRYNQIIEGLVKEGTAEGLSGRPLKRFVTRKIRKILKHARKKIKRVER